MPVTVRALQREADITALYRHDAAEFWIEADVDSAGRRWRIRHEGFPDFRPQQRRGAFLGDTFVGGCLIHERLMVVGAARVPTACVAGVVTAPEYRGRGIGTALMRDTVSFAQEYGHALLLLDGIPNFYRQFGYCDVWDPVIHSIHLDLAPVGTPDGHTVRQATADDAPSLLQMYQRTFYPYVGSFARTVRGQRHLLDFVSAAGRPPLLVEGPAGVCGYLLLPRSGDLGRGLEVCADSWDAVRSLLRAHADLVAAHEAGAQYVRWLLPAQSSVLWILQEHLRLPDRSAGAIRTPAFPSTVENTPGASWQARIGHLPTLIDALLPAFDARLSTAPRSDLVLPLEIDGLGVTLQVGERVLLASGDSSMPALAMSGSDFVRLVFGVRPPHWVLGHHYENAASDVRAALDALFPSEPVWVPPSDWF